VVALSRLEVLSRKSGVPSAALDAHRGEVFLRLERMGTKPSELLAGPEELAAIHPAPLRVAVCDDGAAAVLAAVWPNRATVTVPAPVAADALRLGEARLMPVSSLIWRCSTATICDVRMRRSLAR
jgi:tRNA A37 threonylcarbamoyladenosine modification protein TsaB